MCQDGAAQSTLLAGNSCIGRSRTPRAQRNGINPLPQYPRESSAGATGAEAGMQGSVTARTGPRNKALTAARPIKMTGRQNGGAGSRDATSPGKEATWEVSIRARKAKAVLGVVRQRAIEHVLGNAGTRQHRA